MYLNIKVQFFLHVLMHVFHCSISLSQSHAGAPEVIDAHDVLCVIAAQAKCLKAVFVPHFGELVN
jgi:hypothetical protein